MGITLEKGLIQPEQIVSQHLRSKGYNKRVDKAGKKAAKEYNKAVRKWKNKPLFTPEVRAVKGGYEVSVQIRGTAKARMLWRMVDQFGVRPHIIRPRSSKGVLKFRTKYRPFTTPNGRFSGPGTYSGPTIFSRLVRHPGYRPRNISKRINKRLKKTRL